MSSVKDVNVQHDPQADACYLEMSDKPVVRTVLLSDGVMVDVDESGEPVGVEFLWARDDVPAEALTLVVQRFPSLGAQLLRAALSAA
jgi:uncharacterized protein YuzE